MKKIKNHIDQIRKESFYSWQDSKFRIKCLLGACILHASDRDYQIVNLQMLLVNNFSPTEDFTRRIIKKLTIDHQLLIQQDQFADHLSMNEGYKINKDLVPLEQVQEIVEGDIECTNQEKLFLWKEIVVEELIQYLSYSCRELDLNVPIGLLTSNCFYELLDDLSQGQVVGIIYRAINNALRYLRRNGVTEADAVNSIVPYCYSIHKRFREDGYEIKPFNRHYKTPQSTLSSFCLGKVLNLEEGSYTQKPCFDNMKNPHKA